MFNQNNRLKKYVAYCQHILTDFKKENASNSEYPVHVRVILLKKKLDNSCDNNKNTQRIVIQ